MFGHTIEISGDKQDVIWLKEMHNPKKMAGLEVQILPNNIM